MRLAILPPSRPVAVVAGTAPSLPGPLAFALPTFALSWTLWITAWLLTGRPASIHQPAMLAAIFAGSFAPGLVAAALSARAGPAALRAWLVSFVRFGCGWRAYVVALLPLPLMFLTFTLLLGYSPRLQQAHGLPPIAFYLTLFPVSIFNGAATVLIGAGPLCEEGGWRGYLLPRLLERVGEARAAIVVGVIWAAWHLPVMALFADWRGGVSFSLFLPIYLVGVVALSYIAAVVWRLGCGSLVPCLWLHGVVNAIGAMAFERWAWAGPWSLAARALHSSLVFAAVALVLAALSRRAAKDTSAERS